VLRSSTTASRSLHTGIMQYRALGTTELEVSVVGFGASPLGDVYGATGPEEAKRAVHLAIDEGINFFDVSPYYGQSLAEHRLGSALAGRRHKVVLATKCGRYGANEFDFSARRVSASVDESLHRLRTDYVDLLLAHDVEFGDVKQIVEETIPAMRQLQEQGKARYIGITGFPLRTLIRIARAVPVDAILSYCHYNLLADDLDSILAPFAESQGIGLINASPLHMGLLTEGGGPDWHPAPSEMRKAAGSAVEFCRHRGFDISDLALRFCFDYPGVASTLVGMATREEVRRSLRAFEAPADPQNVRKVRAIVAPVFNRFWPSGREENQ
jgi:aryl-alcohol dehydrogenase-like predicted oxidoreductase